MATGRTYKYTLKFKGKDIIESEYEFSSYEEAESAVERLKEEKLEEIEKYYPQYEIDDINYDDIGENTSENDFSYEIFSEECECSPAWNESYLNTLGMSMKEFA